MKKLKFCNHLGQTQTKGTWMGHCIYEDSDFMPYGFLLSQVTLVVALCLWKPIVFVNGAFISLRLSIMVLYKLELFLIYYLFKNKYNLIIVWIVATASFFSNAEHCRMDDSLIWIYYESVLLALPFMSYFNSLLYCNSLCYTA